MSDVETMIKLATKARSQAYSPYSNFSVGCCIKTKEDNLYAGCNIENASYGLTLCAEACAICNMISSGDKDITDVVILTESGKLCAPCGSCRQQLHEFSSPNTKVHLCVGTTVIETLSMDALLPLAFDAKMLR